MTICTKFYQNWVCFVDDARKTFWCFFPVLLQFQLPFTYKMRMLYYCMANLLKTRRTKFSQNFMARFYGRCDKTFWCFFFDSQCSLVTMELRTFSSEAVLATLCIELLDNKHWLHKTADYQTNLTSIHWLHYRLTSIITQCVPSFRSTCMFNIKSTFIKTICLKHLILLSSVSPLIFHSILKLICSTDPSHYELLTPYPSDWLHRLWIADFLCSMVLGRPT